MEKIKKITEDQTRKDLPDFNSGDRIKVHVRVIEGPRPARVETDAADAAAKPSNPGGSASSANRSAARGASGRQNRPRRRGKKR